MCTAATYKTKDFYFGRTLDYEFSYGDEITITPRHFPLKFRHTDECSSHFAMIGMAHIADGYPLYYDAMNEKGLCMAGLNFVGNAVYFEPKNGKENIAQFEFIPYILSHCDSVLQARKKLENLNITNTQFSDKLPCAQLHWIISDKDESLTVESTKDGLKVYDNPVGVLTNNPPFDIQMFMLNNYMSLSPIMLFGEDNSNGDEYGRSDTMIMMTIDNNHKKLKLTSFQRDTFVYIPGYGYDKLNSSYNYGGAKLSIQTIEANFGIKVDRYAVVDFDSFKKIIDTLGGVDIEVTQDEIDYINYQMYKNNQADTRTTITDAPGTVHLNGQEALWYARNRGLRKGEDGNEIGLDGDDWDRTSRQRKLLETLFTSMKNADLGQIVSIVSSVGPLVTTNLKKDEITALVSHALTYLSYDVEQYYVPEEGLWYYDDKTETWNGAITSTIKISDLEEQRKKFASFVFEELFTGGTSSKETTSASN